MSKLVIVESPAKAKTIGKYLGSDYVVKASMGHLRDLPRKTMGVDLEHDFQPEYGPIEGKDKIISELRKAAQEADFVYLATDPDREGEAISWHLQALLDLKEGQFKRVTFNEITKNAVRYGIAHPRDIDLDLVDAQQARRILDRIVGYRLSPFLWRKVKRGLSAGRVQSVATRLVVDRENEIRAFQPEEYWSIEATLRTAADGVFSARYYGEADGKVELKNEEQTRKVVDDVTGQPFQVATVKKGKKKKSAAPPFTTSTLQQEASRKLNMVPRRTMSVAQELYEGIDLGGEFGLTGLITYMRTDSLRLSDEATAAAAEYIKNRYGEAFYPGKPRVFKTKGGAQDAHEAIRPSNVAIDPESVREQLTPDQYKLYKLIWSRFVACQMADAILDTISADITSKGHVFRASGHTVAFPGFTAVYEESTDDDKQGEKSEAGKPLPVFAEGDTLTADKIESAQHFTQPPARYTEASLIRAMEEKGIGRPSTYAPTIATIIDRDYVNKENRSLRPTPLGEGVTGLLVDKFKWPTMSLPPTWKISLTRWKLARCPMSICCTPFMMDLQPRSTKPKKIWTRPALRFPMKKPTLSVRSAGAIWSLNRDDSESFWRVRAFRSVPTPRHCPKIPAHPVRYAVQRWSKRNRRAAMCITLVTPIPPASLLHGINRSRPSARFAIHRCSGIPTAIPRK